MLAMPPASSDAGVKTAVRVKPLPLIGPSLPPVVTTSPATKLAPGSALKTKLMTAVSPTLTAGWLLVMASVGATVAMSSVGVLPAAPVLPAASV